LRIATPSDVSQKVNAIRPRSIDITWSLSDSPLYFLFSSQHGRSADFEKRSVFEKVFCHRNTADLSGRLDCGLVVALGPSVRCVEQIRSLFKHFPYLL